MRSDMAKVIVERPRRFRGCRARNAPGYPRAKTRRMGGRALDELPTRERMGARYGEKALNENLAPLERYLRAQVGRPWDKIRSEISQHLRLTSAVQKHVLDHLRDFVELHVIERDGVLCGLGRYGGAYPLGRFYRSRAPLYVCPRTGLLAVLRKGDPRSGVLPSGWVRELAADRFALRLRGIWYEVRVAKLPDPPRHRACWDAVASAYIGSTPFYASTAWPAPWGRDRYAVSKRPLTRAERRAIFEQAGVSTRSKG